MRVTALIFLAALIASWSPVSSGALGSAPRAHSAIESEWTHVHPAGETRCAFDTPFSFFYRAGSSPAKLLVYFEGGGACWEFVSCSGMFDTSVDQHELTGFRGMFDFAHRENPFRDYSVVFIPYCTGDVHVGDTVQYYGEASTARPVAHRGYRNVSAVLEWLSRRAKHGAPSHVVVSGTSAGSYGALFYAPVVSRIFPSAVITLIGDSGVPLLKDYPEVLMRWGGANALARIRGTDGPLQRQDLTLERAHTFFAAIRPQALLAHVTSDRDAIQAAFYQISGSPSARAVTYALLDSLERVVPHARSFVVAGADHGLFVTDKFYTYAVGDVRLVDWLRRALAGQPVERLRCAACAVR